ncbi:MAG: hypothetical protein AB8H80_05550 [Planctomycetota bacterium]
MPAPPDIATLDMGVESVEPRTSARAQLVRADAHTGLPGGEPGAGEWAAPLAESMPRGRARRAMERVKESGLKPGQRKTALVATPLAAGMLPLRLAGGFDDYWRGQVGLQRVEESPRRALGALMAAQVPFVVSAVRLHERQLHAGLREYPLATEIYALEVAPKSPLRSLRLDQVRAVFSGRFRTWGELGVDTRSVPGTTRIVACVPADTALRRRLGRVLFGAQSDGSKEARLAADSFAAGGVLADCAASEAAAPAGHAIRIRRLAHATTEVAGKLLRVDGAVPTAQSFREECYPLGLPLQLVVRGEGCDEARDLLDYFGSEAGRSLLGETLQFAR